MGSTPAGVSVAVGLSLLLVAGYLWGLSVNRRVRDAAIRWARDGLTALPAPATFRVLGSAGILIKQPRPRPGVDDLQITVLLEPREVLPLWIWHRLTGRRDLAVLLATLTAVAAADLEIAARASEIGRAAIGALNEAEGWRIVHRGERFTIAARETRDAASLGRELLGLLTSTIPDLAQISVRRGRPTVQVGFPLPGPEAPLASMLDSLAAAARLLQPRG